MSWISALLQFRGVPLRCIFWSSSLVRFTEGPRSEYPHEVSFRLNQTWSGFDFEECSSKALNIWSTACKAVNKLLLKSIWCQCQTLAHIHLFSKCSCSAVLIVTVIAASIATLGYSLCTQSWNLFLQIRKSFAYNHSGKSGSMSVVSVTQLLSKCCRSVLQSIWQNDYSWNQ